ncbi:MAG: cobalamin-binding protein [Cellvibrionaceae bacterium]
MKVKVLLLLITSLSLSSVSVGSEITVTDYMGRKLSLEKPAQRVVALAPHIVENVFSAGAGDLLVGAVNYSDYPAIAKTIPRVGNIQGVSVESIVALKPDLVLGWSSGHSKNVTQKLIDLGITVYLDEPKKLEEVAKSIRDVGLLTGRQVFAEQSATRYLNKLADLQKYYQGRSSVSMLYQVWNNPLQAMSGNHVIGDVIRLCGGANIYEKEPVIAPKISMESVISRNPQAIVASGMGEERPDWLDEWLQWESLLAVQQQHLFFIPPDLIQRHTARLLQGAEILCEQLEQVRQKKAEAEK